MFMQLLKEKELVEDQMSEKDAYCTKLEREVEFMKNELYMKDL